MKTSSSGFDSSKLSTYLNILRFFKKNNDFALHDYKGFLRTKELCEKYTGQLHPGSTLLEIGCGQRFVRTMLFHTEGVRITGIDTDVICPHFSIKGYLHLLSTNGFERFIKTIARQFFFDKQYYKIVEKEYGKPLNKKNIDIRLMSACELDFPDNYFNFIFSNAVFEHIDDIPAACKEVARVLKKDGAAYIGIHLYHSLSGGHHLDWAYPDTSPSNIVPPWDHLRENKYPTHVFLNKLKKDEYISIFNTYFTIVDVTNIYEGERILTEELRRELKNYSTEDLLTRGMKLVIKKK